MKTNSPNSTKTKVTKQAICDPIVLRQGQHIRLVFVPALVDDPSNPKARVDGYFAYERKATRQTWWDVQNSLSTLKAGEGIKLHISHLELLKFLEGLVPLYKFYELAGPAALNAPPMKAGVGGNQIREQVPRSAGPIEESLLSKVVDWLSTAQGREAVARLSSDAPEQIPSLTAALGLASLKAAYNTWSAHHTNDSEEFWQENLQNHAYVLGQLFAYPVLVIGTKAYVGGKSISNTGGKQPDFILSAKSTDSILVLEIKTPITKLMGGEYRRGIFPLSEELQGAIAQVLRYRQTLMRSFDNLISESETRPTLGEPRCIVIAGHSSELNTVAKRECFELQRDRVNGITITTYDELFGKLKDLISILEG